MKLETKVEIDEFTRHASKVFDYVFTGKSYFTCHNKPKIKDSFNIGLIVGSSGSGKSTLLKEFGEEINPVWGNDKAIVSHFETPEKAVDNLSSVGLNSIPTWMKPYHVLSNGEKFRADMSRKLKDNSVIDEFTSVVNRSVAKSASMAISKTIRKRDIKNVVFCSCHEDIIDWLNPDWIFYTDTGEYRPRGSLRQPIIRVDIFRSNWQKWEMFKKHHYLSEELNKACRCYVGVFDGVEIAFNASLSLPGKIPELYIGDSRKKFRESRTVVLPDYQGIGVGTRFSNAIAELFLDDGYRYFSKTAHIRMGEYRQQSNLWRGTSTNLKSREKSQKQSKTELWHHMVLDTKRLCYSHEYLGDLNRYKNFEPNKALEEFKKGLKC